MNILKQSTAATIKFGPMIDDTDGKTAETALSIAQADVRLSKNGGDFAQKNNTAGATHDENGYYDIPLNATDTGTLGRLRVAVSKSGALPVWQDFLVVTANVYDTLCSTDSLDVNVTALADDVITAGKFDESTAFPLKAADTGSTQVARTGADGDTLGTLSDEIATVQADLDNPDQYKADVSGIPAAVWGYATRTLSSFGTLISDIWSHATRTLSAFGFTVATQSDANVTAIKAKTDNLPASPAPAGEYDTRLTAIQTDLNNPDQYKADVSGLALESTLSAIKGAGWTDETLVALMTAIEAISTGSGATPQQIWEYVTRTLTNPNDYKADVSGLATTLHLQDVEDKVDVVDAVADAIKVKTDNLPTSPAPAGEYDAELAAIQADLDNPNQYKADVSALAKTTHVQEVEDKVDAVKLKTDNIPTNPATAGEYTASLAAIQADVSGIPDAILTKAIVDTLTVEQVLKVLAAVETGITTGGGTDTITYTGKDGTEIRLTGVDEDGNRSAVIVIPGA